MGQISGSGSVRKSSAHPPNHQADQTYDKVLAQLEGNARHQAMVSPIAMMKNPHRWDCSPKRIIEVELRGDFSESCHNLASSLCVPKERSGNRICAEPCKACSGEIRVLDLTGKLERPRPKYYVALAV
jgi:hypothetical protein